MDTQTPEISNLQPVSASTAASPRKRSQRPSTGKKKPQERANPVGELREMPEEVLQELEVSSIRSRYQAELEKLQAATKQNPSAGLFVQDPRAKASYRTRAAEMGIQIRMLDTSDGFWIQLAPTGTSEDPETER